ncbi:hypothetical protein [Salipiger abyssi]|uniref:hypothetical protein n=1 Tax=Salipiger abyssi TaxID=1250539 RepID=UPI001A8F0D80|nr:hypothetical protein [Salipiger abyssi]MBN9890575.1 hypothetical protein [Salipiger abyssi]
MRTIFDMRCFFPFLSRIVLGLILLNLPVALFAQTVRVQSGDQFGHGLMFRFNDNCFVALPRHVIVKDNPKLTVFTAAPVVHSLAWVTDPFWKDMDLAVAQVRGIVEDRCTRDLDWFAEAHPEANSIGQLMQLSATGESRPTQMQITESGYLTFDARLAQPDAELRQGISGAFLMVGGKPVGMALRMASQTEGIFLRSEEIEMNLRRWLTRRAGLTVTEVPAAPTPAPVPLSRFEVVSAASAPVSPDMSEQNLIGPGRYVFAPDGPNRIVFRTRDGASAPVSGLHLTSDPEAGHALPRRIRVTVSSRRDGRGDRPFLTGEAGPDGILEQSRMATTAVWVFVTVLDSWDAGSVGIDEIAFD